MSAAVPHFLKLLNMVHADANDAKVCPDGKEKSVGLGIIISRVVFTSNGRVLAISGFSSKLPNIRHKMSPIAIVIPHLRVFGEISIIPVMAIHIAPPFPSAVKFLKNISSHSQAIKLWTNSRMLISKLFKIQPPIIYILIIISDIP